MLKLIICRGSSLFRETPRNFAPASTHENYFTASEDITSKGLPQGFVKNHIPYVPTQPNVLMT
jgi:hypothetical protein